MDIRQLVFGRRSLAARAGALRLLLCFGWLALVAPAPAAAAERFFAPAFKEEMIDFEQCRQYVNGTAAPADAARVSRALGFFPEEGSWERDVWEVGGGTDGAETVYQCLVVLKQPVEIGTLVLGSPEGFRPTRGSTTGGELFYLKADAGAPDPAREAAWVKAEFPSPAQHLRFLALPPGTRTRALLYRDVRARGAAQLFYLRALRPRLQDVTFAAAGGCEPVDGAADPGAVPLGKRWQATPKDVISPKKPVRLMLAWDKPRKLAGIFLFTNAANLRILSYDGRAGSPFIAPADAWDPVKFADEWDYAQALPSWHWLSFTPLQTAALQLEVTGVTWGKECWIQGFAAMTPLGDQPPLALKPREMGPPFRFPAALPVTGDAAMVIDDANGRRVRNLFAQTFRPAGAADQPWDLRDDAGNYVEPGTYSWKGIAGPQLELIYGVTPYPNLQNFFPDRMPWMVGHTGVHGWLADHGPNFACATTGDRVYFGATLAEAGVSFIECDLDGRRQWAQHDFGGWIGVYRMAADAANVYVLDAARVIHRIETAARKDAFQFRPSQGPNRRGDVSSMAARDGKVYLAYSGGVLFENSARAADLDLASCLPLPPDNQLARLLRMEGVPPGFAGAGSHQPGFVVSPTSPEPQGNGRLYLEAERLGKILARKEAAALPKVKQPDDVESLLDGLDEEEGPAVKLETEDRGPWLSVIAFKQPVALGSIVFPWPAAKGTLQFAALKPDAPYPPRAEKDDDWIPFENAGGPGWNCVAAPPRTMTRAVRVRLEPAAKDEIFWRLDGLRLLNRRFASLFPTARVRVSSGEVSRTGEWDAQRTEPVWPDKPGIYVMDWKNPQKLCGLAIKEIDGAAAEIDVWQGPAPGDIPLDGPAADRRSSETGWRNVATYRQDRRNGGYSYANNRYAWYLDGCVEFGETVETRAVRIRITEQWLDNGLIHGGALYVRRHDGRSEHGMHFSQSYCVGLDTRICKVMGVAPLSPLGGDVPGDPLIYQRLEVWDGMTGKLVKELPVKAGWDGLAFAPDGALYAIEDNHKVISRVDLDTGAMTPVIRDAEPGTFTIGPDGLFYIHSYGDRGTRPVLVCDAQGRKVREIGHPGGFRAGLWDPQRFGAVRAMCVDKAGGLWVLESQDNPRRIVQFKTDGTFVKELLGNTHYGGHGTIDRSSRSRAFHDAVEFEIDWDKHTSRIRAFYGWDYIGGEPDVRRCNGRNYLVSAPLVICGRQAVGMVHLYDEKEGTARLVAAMGEAEYFAPLRRSEIMALLTVGAVPNAFEFVWSDRNGNGTVDAAEVDFKEKAGPFFSVGHFDDRLACPGKEICYEVAEFLPDGVPVYRRTPAPGWPMLRLNDGSGLTMADHGPGPNVVVAPDGTERWSYPAHGGVSGLYIPPWEPGQVTNQLSVIGHDTAHAGDLGEFFVINDNTGQWRIWSADGLLAGNIFFHQGDPRARLLGPPDVKFEQRIDPLTTKQEHFHGFFARTQPGDRYYAVAGFTHMSVIEVRGIEKFRRAGGTFTVAAAEIDRARRWEAERFKRRSGGESALLIARDSSGVPPEIDGQLSTEEWPHGVPLPGNPNVLFRLMYDRKNLYLCWSGKGVGVIANDAPDFRRIFKTGACLDFQIGADENADPKRTAPVAGDQRLLITFAGNKPCVALYQPVSPGAAAGEAWSTKTEAAGTSRFDRVVQPAGVKVAMGIEMGFAVEAAVPLSALGLAPREGLRLRGDWGILTSEDGHQVKARMYWSNLGATGTSDEAMESRLEPGRWGSILFDIDPEAGRRRPDLIEDMPEAGPDLRYDLIEELKKR